MVGLGACVFMKPEDDFDASFATAGTNGWMGFAGQGFTVIQRGLPPPPGAMLSSFGPGLVHMEFSRCVRCEIFCVWASACPCALIYLRLSLGLAGDFNTGTNERPPSARGQAGAAV